MADMTVWYIVLLVGTACVILGARSLYTFRKQMRQGEVSSEDLEGVDTE